MNIINIASGSSGNCYTIDDGKTVLMFECGINFDKIIKGCDLKRLKRVTACLISHEHLDHCKIADQLSLHGVPVICSEGTAEKLNCRCDIIKEFVPKKIGTFTVVAFPAEHNAEQPLSFIIHSQPTNEKLLFIIDSYYCKYQLAEIDYLMIECNHDLEELADVNVNDKHLEYALNNHMSVQNLMLILQKVNTPRLKEIYLIHASESNLNHEKAVKAVKRATGKPVKIALKNGGWK